MTISSMKTWIRCLLAGISVKLFQRAKTGKIKWTDVYTDGAKMITEWGVIGSDKRQNTIKVCIGKNIGKSNELTPEQQAIAEMEAKLTKKKEKGYLENIDDVTFTATVEMTLDDIPKSFCPSKPAPEKNMKDKFRDHPQTYGQRKRDGHCIILVKTSTTSKVYSRGMQDITFYMKELPVVQEFFNSMRRGQMIFTEFCFVKANGKDSTREISKIVRKKDPVEVVNRYNEAITRGKFEIVPFDIMFNGHSFMGNMPYLERKSILDTVANNVPVIHRDWKNKIDLAREEEWEGFVLRNDILGSKIHYTLNGKADKAGCFKYVFVKSDDFVVTGALHGKSGRHANYYAKFFISQYVDNKLVEYGNCGPGKLEDDELTVLKERIDTNELKFPFVIEVEYRDRHEDTGKLVFPVLQRLREDKRVEECIFQD